MNSQHLNRLNHLRGKIIDTSSFVIENDKWKDNGSGWDSSGDVEVFGRRRDLHHIHLGQGEDKSHRDNQLTKFDKN